MLNLDQLEAFVAVVDTQGFRGAAQQLGCSQPTVSQQLRKLEEFLGVQLIARSRLLSTPTLQGARLIPLARSLLRTAERARDVVTGQRLSIGASSNIGIYLLQPYVAQMAQTLGTKTNIELKIASNPEIADALSRGELDIAVMEWWDRREGFTAKKWRQEKLVVIVSPDHPWARKKTVRASELLEEPMIGGEAGTGTGTLLETIFGKKASKMRISMNVGSTEAVKAAVKAGLGVSLVFASAVEAEVSSGSLRALAVSEVNIAKDLFLILPEQMLGDSAARRFAQMLTGDAKS
jgi:DNA-binding transcriptional LysR family regulator